MEDFWLRELFWTILEVSWGVSFFFFSVQRGGGMLIRIFVEKDMLFMFRLEQRGGSVSTLSLSLLVDRFLSRG